eukprot:5301455-Prymnesium_polylepis.1
MHSNDLSPFPTSPDAQVRLDAWRMLASLRAAGYVREIGVPNFSPCQMAALLAVETPAVPQARTPPRHSPNPSARPSPPTSDPDPRP